ncbi:MAG: hypothetical protein RR315_02115, partial [Oscillospiraceae bacterium]
MLIALVILSDTTPAFDKPYSYILPEAFKERGEGYRCMVPFGRGSKERWGFILRVTEGDGTGLKAISKILDKEPLLNAEGLYLV